MFIAGTPMELYASLRKSELERVLEGEAISARMEAFGPGGDYRGARDITVTAERRLQPQREYHRNHLDKPKLATIAERGEERYVLVLPYTDLARLYTRGRGNLEANSVEVHINQPFPKEWARTEKEAKRPYGRRVA